MNVEGLTRKSRAAATRRRSADASPEESTAQSSSDSGSSDFGAYVTKALTKNGETDTNEEAVFSALVRHGVSSRGDSNALAKLEERMEKHARILERKVGYSSDEKAAKFALRDLVRNKLISKDEATELYSKAFSAAQLDSDTEALSDGIGGNGSTASASVESVVGSLEAKMAALTAAASAYTKRNLGEGSTRSALDIDGTSFADLATQAVLGSGTTSSSPVDGANGFLFKPISDTQGKLVILTPEELTGRVTGVILKDSSGNVLEKGSSGGVGNGGREHFRYTKPGSQYPSNLVVEVQLAGGGSKTYSIPDPSKRYD
jgi:hypothetical protein